MENPRTTPESTAPNPTTRFRKLGRALLAGATNYFGTGLVVAGALSGGILPAVVGIGAGSAFLYGSRELLRNKLEPDASPRELQKRSIGKRLARGALFFGSSLAAYLSTNLLVGALWPRAIFEHGIPIASRIALGGVALVGEGVSIAGIQHSYEDNPFDLINEPSTDPVIATQEPAIAI